MVPMEQMGKLAGVPTPVTTSIIELAGAVLGQDLRKSARDLAALGLAGLSIDQLKQFFDEGHLKKGG